MFSVLLLKTLRHLSSLSPFLTFSLSSTHQATFLFPVGLAPSCLIFAWSNYKVIKSGYSGVCCQLCDVPVHPTVYFPAFNLGLVTYSVIYFVKISYPYIQHILSSLSYRSGNSGYTQYSACLKTLTFSSALTNQGHSLASLLCLAEGRAFTRALTRNLKQWRQQNSSSV